MKQGVHKFFAEMNNNKTSAALDVSGASIDLSLPRAELERMALSMPLDDSILPSLGESEMAEITQNTTLAQEDGKQQDEPRIAPENYGKKVVGYSMPNVTTHSNLYVYLIQPGSVTYAVQPSFVLSRRPRNTRRHAMTFLTTLPQLVVIFCHQMQQGENHLITQQLTLLRVGIGSFNS